MPSFLTLKPEEVRALQARRSNLEDLGPFIDFLKPLPVGTWAEIELLPGEHQRTVKRRTSIAATALGKAIRWRRASQPGKLVLVLEARP